MKNLLVILAVILVLVLVIGGMGTLAADSAADTAQAVATYKVAEIASIQAQAQMIEAVTRAIVTAGVVLVVIVGAIAAAVVIVRRTTAPKVEDTPRRWVSGPNARWGRVDEGQRPPMLAGTPQGVTEQLMAALILKSLQDSRYPQLQAPPPAEAQREEGRVAWWD